MSGAGVTAPPGFTRLQLRDATIVARHDCVEPIRNALREVRTLHCWAATVPGAQAYHGRATAWGARLPDTATDVVVRHAQHGGLLAALTGDRFLWPGRAPWELEASERLRAARVRTPMLIAYALYPAGPGFCRSDVLTLRLPAGDDFPAVWRSAEAGSRTRILRATAALVAQLQAAGAVHEDLNVKNIYLSFGQGEVRAYALDVDRVQFRAAADRRVTARNLARLTRSMRKAREQFGIKLSESDITALGAEVEQHLTDSPSPDGSPGAVP